MPNDNPASEQRLAQIHQAALELFVRDGYHETSMDAIAEKAGIAKGTLYWYFKGKRELFLALFRHVMQELVASWRAYIAPSAWSPAAQLRASLQFFRERAEQIAQVFGIVVQARTLNWQDEEIIRSTRETMQLASQVLEENIARGVASREFRPVSPHQMSFVLISLVTGLVLRMRAGGPVESWPELINTIEVLLTRGLLAPHAGEG
jgi:AcrR family transcriptional regulator